MYKCLLKIYRIAVLEIMIIDVLGLKYVHI